MLGAFYPFTSISSTSKLLVFLSSQLDLDIPSTPMALQHYWRFDDVMEAYNNLQRVLESQLQISRPRTPSSCKPTSTSGTPCKSTMNSNPPVTYTSQLLNFSPIEHDNKSVDRKCYPHAYIALQTGADNLIFDIGESNSHVL